MAPTLGDIILVPFKFTDGETSIMELALVHSDGKYILRLYSQVHTCGSTNCVSVVSKDTEG